MDNLAQRIAQIRDDREHGSRWLVYQAISLLHDLASEHTLPAPEQLEQVREAALELAHARPAMAALAVAVGRVVGAQDSLAGIAHAASQLLAAYNHAVERITAY